MVHHTVWEMYVHIILVFIETVLIAFKSLECKVLEAVGSLALLTHPKSTWLCTTTAWPSPPNKNTILSIINYQL
jgi:hypothetical protein